MDAPCPALDLAPYPAALADAALVLDESGHIVAANAALERLLGRPVIELTGTCLPALMTAACRPDCEAWLALWTDAPYASAAPTTHDAELRASDGRILRVALSLGAFPLGGARYVLATLRDRSLERAREEELAALRSAHASLRAHHESYRLLFEQAPAAFAVLRGPDFRYELSNAKNQEFAGGRTLVGKTLAEALPELEAQGVLAIAKQVYETGEPFVSSSHPVTLPAVPGRPARDVWLTAVMQPLRGPTGDPEGLMVFSYEVTDLVRTRARAEEAEQRLRLSLDAARLGTWEYDGSASALHPDDGFRALFGVPAGAPLTAEQIVAAIHPDDRERVSAAGEEALAGQTGGEYEVEFRARGIADGVERWIAMRGRSLREQPGAPERFRGVAVDVTRERVARERLRLLGEASATLAESLDVPTTLAHLAHCIVPRMADLCVVELHGAGIDTAHVAVAHADPAAHAEALRGGLAHEDDAEPLLVTEVDGAQLARWARDDAHLEALRALALRAVLRVPVALGARVLGVLTLAHAQSGRSYTRDDLAFACELAGRAALAIENARLFAASQAAVRRRDEFLSIASHELKTPVTSLSLYLDVLVRDAQRGTLTTLAPDKALGRVTKASAQVRRLTRLIDQLLDVSRLGSGKLELTLQAMDLCELVREVMSRFADQASATSTPLALHAPEPVLGSWDRDRLDQVVTNLLANALKYASGKPIEIEVFPGAPGTAVLSVRDHGPGIAPDDHVRIFERFERTAATRNVGGFGLGLWIVREMVRAHGGGLFVESALAEGARFTVELPGAS